jgi:hypothetical protein
MFDPDSTSSDASKRPFIPAAGPVDDVSDLPQLLWRARSWRR